MKVNTTIKAILMAALAAIAYTIPLAQAATEKEMQSDLVAMKTGYKQGDVYALTFTVNTYQGYEGEGQLILEMEPLTFNGSGNNDGYFLMTNAATPTSVYLSADDNNPRSYGSSSSIANTWLTGSWDANTQTNTYTKTPQRQQDWFYGGFSEATNGTHTTQSQTTARLQGATYTVAYDGKNTTIMMKTTDGITNKAVLQGVSLNFNDFTFEVLNDSDSSKLGHTAIATGELPTLTKVYSWDGATTGSANAWADAKWKLAAADGQNFKDVSSGTAYDVEFSKAGAAVTVNASVHAGKVDVKVDQTIAVESNATATFANTVIAADKTLTLKSASNGTINLGAVTMADAELVVDATAGSLNIVSTSDLEVATMTIGEGKQVGVSTGTVTITESLTAGAGTLNAKLVLDGATLNLNGAGENALTLGSQLGFAEGTLVALDDVTIQALEGLEIGDTLDLIKASTTLSYDKDYNGMKFGELFVRPDTLVGDYQVVADGSSFGLTKVSNVPEPTTGTLSLLALADLAARRRRK